MKKNNFKSTGFKFLTEKEAQEVLRIDWVSGLYGRGYRLIKLDGGEG
jgi:hypothetical protein